MEIKLGHKKMKLFGFQFYVPINDEQEEEQLHNPPPPEYSSAPTYRRPSPPPLLHHDVQESHVAPSEVVSAATAAADVITGNPDPSSAAAHEEEVHKPPPPEYSPAPTGDGASITLLLHVVQEKRVLESHAAAAADVITGNPGPSSAAAHVEEVHKPPPSEYFPPPPGDGGPPVTLLLHVVQEKRVLESHHAAAAAADVITGSPPSSGSSSDDVVKIPMKSKKRKFAEEIQDYPSSSSHINNGTIVVYNPTPLQSFPPTMNHQEAVGPTSPVPTPTTTTINGGRKNKRAKSDEKKPAEKKPKRKTGSDNEDAVLPSEEIRWLMEKINSGNENGSSSSSSSSAGPVFLYRKKLEVSDIRSDQNRLMVNGEDKLLEFLTEEERKAVLIPRDQETKPRGFELTGVDQNGKLYKLCYILWGSLNKTAINKQWNKLVSEHNAKKGDTVEIWGYRLNNNENEPRFVIIFRKADQNMVDDKATGSSSLG
ncbi:hypothetical protein ACP275_07G071500 [Erythranthe tilingii]